MPNLATFIRYAARALRWARGPAELRHTGVLSGLLPDGVSEAARSIVRWSMPLVNTPEDAIPHLLRHYGLPPYAESYAATLTRLRDTWPTHEIAGAEDMLAAEAERCGITNAVITRDNDTDSAFWIEGDNIDPVIPAYDTAGTIYTGGGIVYGCQPPSNDVAKNLRSMIRYFRPARERYRGLRRIVEPDYHADLALWLDAAEGVTGSAPITAWEDRHTLATYTASSTPTLRTVGGTGGLPDILVNGTDHFIADATGLGFNDCTFFVVFNQQFSGSTNRALVGSTGNNALYAANSSGVNGILQAGVTRDFDNDVTGPQLLTLRIKANTSTLHMRRNGVPHAIGAVAGGNSFITQASLIHIGAHNGAHFLAGVDTSAISEIIAYQRALDFNEIRAVERYVGRKFELFDWDEVL